MKTSLIAVAALVLLTGCGNADTPQASDVAVSGTIEHGLRVLTIDPATTDQHFVVYRGDYVRPVMTGTDEFMVEIPDLEVAMAVPVPEGERAYFKVPTAGRYAFTAGAAKGVIESVEYAASAYREVSSKEAAGLIANLEPVILDVRTPREFNQGHIADATLIPVQQIQARVGELAAHKDGPVFVYCRTGNRSTVAAKVLVDAGHKHVINLRRGIVEWSREGLPVVN